MALSQKNTKLLKGGAGTPLNSRGAVRFGRPLRKGVGQLADSTGAAVANVVGSVIDARPPVRADIEARQEFVRQNASPVRIA